MGAAQVHQEAEKERMDAFCVTQASRLDRPLVICDLDSYRLAPTADFLLHLDWQVCCSDAPRANYCSRAGPGTIDSSPEEASP